MRDFFLRYGPVFQILTLVCGIALMAQAFGGWGVPRDPEVRARWQKESAPTLRIASTVIVLSSLVVLIARLF